MYAALEWGGKGIFSEVVSSIPLRYSVYHAGWVYPPPPTLHPIVGQQSQISWMKQLQWAEMTFLISLQTQ